MRLPVDNRPLRGNAGCAFTSSLRDSLGRPLRGPLVAFLFAALVASPWAQSKSTDRQQPMDIAADRTDSLMADDGESTLMGNVNITQGSLNVQADQAVILRKGGEIAAVTLTGSPAVLKQISPSGEPMTARAQRIVYRMDSEIVVLTGQVEIEQPRGSLRGETIKYDLSSGRLDGGGDGSRVQMRILPKAAPDAGSSKAGSSEAGSSEARSG